MSIFQIYLVLTSAAVSLSFAAVVRARRFVRTPRVPLHWNSRVAADQIARQGDSRAE